MIAPYLEALRARWQLLQRREQLALAVCALVVVLALAYTAVIKPVYASQERAEQRLLLARQVAIDLELAATRFGGGNSRAPRSSSSQTLISVIDRSIRSSQIGKPASRLQPDGDSRARIWIEDANFNALVAWLEELGSKHGIDIDNADIERTSGPGLVDVRLTLVRR